jgi:hypothetical protein
VIVIGGERVHVMKEEEEKEKEGESPKGERWNWQWKGIPSSLSPERNLRSE